MIYKLPPARKRNPLLPWIYIFNSLSIKQFCLVHDKLDFPACPPQNVRQLAHDFVLTRQLMYRNDEYFDALEALLHDGEATSFDLLEGVSPDARIEEKLEGLFSNSFAYLEKFGYAETIYNWGRHTQGFHEFADIQSLQAMCRLLRRWAVMKWVNQSISTVHTFYSGDREKVLLQYAPIYTRTTFPIPPLEPLRLSDDSSTTLQSIILDEEARQLSFKNTMDTIMSSPRSLWEDFALRAGAADVWMRLEGGFRICLQEWRRILDHLSATEIGALEQWALQNKAQERDLQLPLPNFQTSSSNL